MEPTRLVDTTCFGQCTASPTICIILMTLIVTTVTLITVALTVFIFCKIFAKAGYSWALGLLMVIPIANIIMPFVLAFGDWPVHRQLRKLKQQLQNQQT